MEIFEILLAGSSRSVGTLRTLWWDSAMMLSPKITFLFPTVASANFGKKLREVDRVGEGIALTPQPLTLDQINYALRCHPQNLRWISGGCSCAAIPDGPGMSWSSDVITKDDFPLYRCPLVRDFPRKSPCLMTPEDNQFYKREDLTNNYD